MSSTDFKNTQLLVGHGEAYSNLTVTGLSNPTAASNNFEGGKKAYADKRYDKAIQSYTRTINILQRDLETALLHRAIAFEMKRKYKSAIQDTLRANPTSTLAIPDPYLTMANTLLLQDKLHKAASHLMSGLAVIPDGHVNSERLSHLYRRVVSEINRRNSRIASILPPEVLDYVLPLLPIKVCIQLSLTCRYWNNYIMREWEGMWMTIDSSELHSFQKPYKRFIKEKVLKSIPANRVRFVTDKSERSCESSCTDEVMKAAARYSWNRIEYLGVLNPRKKSFLEVLQLNRSSIKAMEIWDYESPSSTVWDKSNGYCQKALTDAAEICTSLRSISLHHSTCQGVPINSQLRTSINLILTRLMLKLSVFKYKDPNDQYKNYTSTLCFINSQCPMLQELTLGTLIDNNDDLKLTYSQVSLDSSGLVSLNITIPGTHNNPFNVKFNQQVGLLIQKSRRSLKTLKLCVTEPSSPHDCDLLLVIANIGLPALANLEFSVTSPPQNFRYHNLRDLISACPALEQVRIHGGGIWDTRVMEELSNLSSLRRLDIYLGFCSDVIITCSGNRNSLISLLEQSRTLRSFSFGYICHHGYTCCGCDSMKTRRYLLTNVSRCVANSNIQEYDISNTSIAATEELASIIDTLNNSQIRTLAIRIIRIHFGTRELEAIASLRNVSFLKIYDEEDNLNEYQLHYIFDKHKKGRSDIFVVSIGKYRNYRTVSGRKLYPITQECEVHSKDGKIKSKKYYEARYAVKDIAQ